MTNNFYGGNHVHHHYSPQPPSMPPPRPVDTRSVWRQHPFVGALVALIGFFLAVSLVVNLWYVVLPIALIGCGGFFGIKKLGIQRAERAALAARAEAEHAAYTRGDAAGIYGRFTPPEV
ncbi:MAG: hypothetical protein QME72_04350 [Rhodococcus sp. (in: high G+C Gram-positive bacteria)]|nr:hypothetical protein [Rhodococcus sp. (in: high G+C Gram-positive bacteria)]MDI6626932.1 hypothetical protein [Rhodococcus sp. (in: high G+C Gram-positive bacteria)]